MKAAAYVCLFLAVCDASAANELVSTTRLRLRDGPSLAARTANVLATGTPVELLSNKPEGNYFNVRLKDRPEVTGWVSGKYVTDSSLGEVRNQTFTLRRFPEPEALDLATRSTKYPDCGGAHFFRWEEKTASSQAGQTSLSTTIKQVLGWAPLPIGKDLASWCEARSGRELKRYTVTGWARTIRTEADGDLHVELTSTANAAITSCIVVEIPPQSAGPEFASARDALDNAVPKTNRSGPTVKQPVKLGFQGLAFFDGWHATSGLPSGHGNCNSTKGAVWELHPIYNVVTP